MLYHNVRIMGYYLRSIDAAAIGATSAGAWWLGALLGAWPWHASWGAMVLYSATIVLAFLLLAGRMHAYHARRTEHLVQEFGTLCELSVYAAGLACIATEILTPGLPGLAYVAMLASGLAVLLGLRLVMRVVIRRLRRKGNDYRVWLIIGHNARAARLAEMVLSSPHFGIRIDEIVDLNGKPDSKASNRRQLLSGGLLGSVPSRVIDSAEEIREIVAGRVIDEVVVTLPLRSHYDEVRQILDICFDAGISVKLPPEGFYPSGYRTEVSQVGNIPIMTHYNGPASQTHLVVKRVIDVVGSAVGLTLLSPLFFLIMLAIKLTSRGSVFFVQTRVGLHGRHFRIIKFRSMTQDAAERREGLAVFNEMDGPAFKIKDDPRITPVGRFLRRFHLDELPQLLNVLIGDMSLVGPRPLPPKEAHGNEWWQRRRLSMPPGLTCFWQVRGDPRLPHREWMQLDLAYIDRWSLWLDLRLIASTVSTVIQGKGW